MAYLSLNRVGRPPVRSVTVKVHLAFHGSASDGMVRLEKAQHPTNIAPAARGTCCSIQISVALNPLIQYRAYLCSTASVVRFRNFSLLLHY